MRYALIFSFVLGFSAVAFPLQADEVGGGFCDYCAGGNSMTDTTDDDSSADTDTQSDGGSGGGGGGWWSLMLELVATEE